MKYYSANINLTLESVIKLKKVLIEIKQMTFKPSVSITCLTIGTQWNNIPARMKSILR